MKFYSAKKVERGLHFCMPELPEVETTINDLSRQVVFSKIKRCWIGLPLKVSLCSDFPLSDYEKIIKGKTIKSIERKGKNIIIELSNEISILIHQKISGHVLLGKWEKKFGKWVPHNGPLADKINSYIHFVLTLSDGQMIAVSDPRQFFKIEFWKKKDLAESKVMKSLGKDALEISQKEFKESLRKRKQDIKKLLINQNFIAGIGNIYSDEILWEAQINPFRKACSLDEKETEKLFKAMVKILKTAIRLKGDSVSDYRLVSGQKGGYQNFHRVYQREGLSCKRKDGGIIEKEKFGNRHLRYCPVCQK